MSAPRIQVSRALDVYPNDDVNIPYPNLVNTGSNTSVVTDQLVDTNVDFITMGIKIGDTVWNATTNDYALVTGVYTNVLELSLDIFTLVGTGYGIYQGENTGCLLYVGKAGNVAVTTTGGDEVVFASVNAGQFLPVQVLKVMTATTAGNILAIW